MYRGGRPSISYSIIGSIIQKITTFVAGLLTLPSFIPFFRLFFTFVRCLTISQTRLRLRRHRLIEQQDSGSFSIKVGNKNDSTIRCKIPNVVSIGNFMTLRSYGTSRNELSSHDPLRSVTKRWRNLDRSSRQFGRRLGLLKNKLGARKRAYPIWAKKS